MIDRALRDDPELLPVQMQQAEFYEIIGNSEKSNGLYRQLLERDELTGPSRAIVLNNLAYLLATTETSTAAMEEALKYVDEATQILGPVSDILDSRAVVLIQAKRYADAIAALELAVTDNPTPSKYFHKALAHFRAGQNESAPSRLEKSRGIGPRSRRTRRRRTQTVRRNAGRTRQTGAHQRREIGAATQFLPLPPGEGRGEGEVDIKLTLTQPSPGGRGLRCEQWLGIDFAVLLAKWPNRFESWRCAR